MNASRIAKSVAGIGLVAAIGTTAQVASASYLSEIANQSPLLFWEMNESTATSPMPESINNLDALLGVGNFTNNATVGGDIVLGGASMTPGGGFLGFGAGNTSYNFNNAGSGSVVTNLTSPRQSMSMVASSISMWVNSTDPNDGGSMNGTLWRRRRGLGPQPQPAPQ